MSDKVKTVKTFNIQSNFDRHNIGHSCNSSMNKKMRFQKRMSKSFCHMASSTILGIKTFVMGCSSYLEYIRYILDIRLLDSTLLLLVRTFLSPLHCICNASQHFFAIYKFTLHSTVCISLLGVQFSLQKMFFLFKLLCYHPRGFCFSPTTLNCCSPNFQLLLRSGN